MSSIAVVPHRSPVIRTVAYRVVTPRRSAVARLRLTRRGRVVVVLAALLLAFVVGAFVAAASSVAAGRPGSPAPTRIVQVHEGDTMWAIAAGLTRDGDVRATMSTIEHLNAMTSTDVRVGQRLVVPAG